MALGIRLLPLTIAMACLVLAIKIGDVMRGSEALSKQLLVGDVVAETESTPAVRPPEMAAPEGHGAPATPKPASPKVVSKRPEGVDDKRFTPAELDILQNLSKRREELDKWEQNIQLKENLLAAAEMRVNEKLDQVMALKSELSQLIAQYDEQENTKIKSLVKIYESMKPKDAARIFEELEMPVLLEVVDKMSEKKAAPILAAMNPMKAKRLTVELAEQRRSAVSKVDAAKGASAPDQANP